jgi:predicted ATPase
VVTKSDFAARVWRRAAVDEGCLRFHISALRRALGDGSGSARYIVTLTGQGYCLVAPVVRTRTKETLPVCPPIDGRGKLPQRLTRIVGRDATINEISSYLTERRLVTIVGPGGIGKTTVALAIAHNMLAQFDGAVHFIDFGTMRDGTLVPAALASMLGVMIHASDPLPGLIKFLRARPTLLVLDSCEPIIDAAALLTERLNKEVANIAILATSREALRAEEEYVYQLPALESPPDDVNLTAVTALKYSAAQLFVERLFASGQRFELSDRDAPILAEVCRKLDGIALAIELAASSVNAYGLRGIANLLNGRDTLFWQGRRTAVARHQTLHATLDWSYDLLTEHERLLLRRLSVFVGTFTFDAPNIVSADPDGQVAPALANLIAKSLVQVEWGGGQPRYRLLDTTRAYGFEKLLASGEYDAVARRHAIYCRGLLDHFAMSPASQAANYNEHLANVRAALDWSFGSRRDLGLAIELAACSAQLFLELSLLTECHRWTERAIEALSTAHSPDHELILQSALGVSLMFVDGNSNRARDALTRALDLAEQLNEATNQLQLLVRLHFFTERMGDFHGALAFAQRGKSVAQHLADTSGAAAAHSMLGSSYHIMGAHEAARPHLEAAAAITQTSSPRVRIIDYGFDPCTRAAVVLSRTLWVLGFSDRALSLANSTVARAEEGGHPIPICIASIWAASTCFCSGDLDQAEQNIRKFIEYADRYSIDSYHAVGLGATGKLLTKRGDVSSGVRLLEASLATLHARRYELHTAAFNTALAEGLALLGHVDRSIAILDETISSIERGGNMFRMPELLRLKGVLLCSSPNSDRCAAESCLFQSLRLANQQSALAWELRTASSIAKMWIGEGRCDEARDLLATVYHRFTEGFDCSDLKEARQLLDQLEQHRFTLAR